MADFHHRFFPLASFGMGIADETSDNGLEYGTGKKQEFNFKSNLAPFGKIGFAYNIDYNSTRPNDLYLVFLRYGLSYNKADISNLYYADELWGSLGPISINDQEYTELCSRPKPTTAAASRVVSQMVHPSISAALSSLWLLSSSPSQLSIAKARQPYSRLVDVTILVSCPVPSPSSKQWPQ